MSDDPELWLAQADPRKLAIWQAFYRVEPWGNDQHSQAMTSAMVSGVMAITAAGLGGKFSPQNESDFMPADWAYSRPSGRLKRPSVATRKKQIELLKSVFPKAAGRDNGNIT